MHRVLNTGLIDISEAFRNIVRQNITKSQCFSCLMDGALWIPQMIPSTNQQIPVSRVRPDTALRCSDRVLAAPQNGRKWGGGMPRNDLRAPSRRLFPSPRAIWICLKWGKKGLASICCSIIVFPCIPHKKERRFKRKSWGRFHEFTSPFSVPDLNEPSGVLGSRRGIEVADQFPLDGGCLLLRLMC